MHPAPQNTFRELVIGLGALLTALLAPAAIVWVNIGHLQVAAAADDEAREELSRYAAVMEAMLDQETGVQGFAIMGDPAFLAPYDRGRLEFRTAMDRLTALAADDPPEMRRRVQDIGRQVSAWTTLVAEPQIAAARNHVPALHDGPTGKPQLDAIRGDIAALRHAEMQLLGERDVIQAQAYLTSRVTLILGSGLALAFALLIAGRSFRRLSAGTRDAEAAAALLRDALERAQTAERAKTLFLSNMSHEMRTPLNGVSGMAQALAATPLNAHQHELLATVSESAATLDRLIGNLLALSGGDASEGLSPGRTAIQLGDACRQMVAEYAVQAGAKGLALTADVAASAELRVVGDTARLRKMTDCLVSNAIKFTDRGEVRLGVERVGGDRYRFTVTDTGIGFDEALKAELFETFSRSDDSMTRRHGGAGLGLALARQLAAELGGRLDCQSTPGVGSVFAFETELAAEDAGALTPAPAAPQPAGHQPLTMLIVDDNATNRKVLEVILEQLGVASVSVEDGQQAVEAAAAQDFAAILMDIQMPVMDGLTATREIRRLEREAGRPATPVIIVSANGQPEHVEAGRAAGAQRHLTKPVDAAQLVEALNSVLPDEAKTAQAA